MKERQKDKKTIPCYNSIHTLLHEGMCKTKQKYVSKLVAKNVKSGKGQPCLYYHLFKLNFDLMKMRRQTSSSFYLILMQNFEGM